MKSIKILFLLMFINCLTTPLFSQSLEEIKAKYTPIDGGERNPLVYDQNRNQENEIIYILNLDIFKYYSLEKTYDSELKRKIYSESEEYAIQKNTLSNKRKELLTDKYYYLDYTPTYPQRKDNIKYNLASKSFNVYNEKAIEEFFNKEFIQFDRIAFKPITGISVINEEVFRGTHTNMNIDIHFKIEDQNTALKIEDEAMNLKLLFLLKFEEAIPFKDGVMDFPYSILKAKLLKVIVYNSETNFVYKTFE